MSRPGRSAGQRWRGATSFSDCSDDALRHVAPAAASMTTANPAIRVAPLTTSPRAVPAMTPGSAAAVKTAA